MPGPHRSFKPRKRQASPARAAGPVPLDDRARDAAIRALARQARGYPEMAPDALDFQFQQSAGAEGWRAIDGAFAHAIYDAAIRRWLTLAYLLNREIRQGFDALEPRARAVLLAGAAQLLFLDRAPPHAVINHGVEWAKRVVRPGAGGLVNAVLRRIADLRAGARVEPGPWTGQRDALPLPDGRLLHHDALGLPDDPIDRLAIATSHPRDLLTAWSARWPEAAVRALALHSLVDPPLILNAAHSPSDAIPETETAAHAEPGHRVVTGGSESLARILASSPRVWVQDPSSAGAVGSIADLRPGLVVDLCAGRGTKTRQLAAAFPDARIMATDIDAARYAMLQETFLADEQVTVAPFQKARDLALMKADLVLLDVPCSNTGVLPRRPEARYRFGPKSLASLADMQRQLIADAIPLLSTRPGARPAILYATCSIEPSENQDMAAWARQWHRFGIERERSVLPTGLPGDPPTAYRDGAYSALLMPR